MLPGWDETFFGMLTREEIFVSQKWGDEFVLGLEEKWRREGSGRKWDWRSGMGHVI